MKKTVTYIDPPSGHGYGYPKILPDDVVDLKQWLIEKGYPEKDIDLPNGWYSPKEFANLILEEVK